MKNASMKAKLKFLPFGLIAMFVACSTDNRVPTADVAPKRAYEAGMADNWVRRGTSVEVAEAPPAETRTRTTPLPKPAPAPAAPRVAAAPRAAAPSPAPTVTGSCTDGTGGLVPTTITMPREASFGDNFTYEINASASQCVANVVITEDRKSVV